MIIVQSKSPTIADLRVHPMPSSGKVLKATRTVRVGTAVVVVDEKGTVYSSQVRQGMSFDSPMTCQRHRDTLSACVRLGLFTKEALAKHRTAVEEADRKYERRHAAELLTKSCKALGVPMSITQSRAVRAALAVKED